MRETLTYLKSLATDKDVASITPSSSFCINKVSLHIDFTKPNIIVEFGGGTGVFTKSFLDQLSPDSKLFVFETNSLFFQKLQEIDDPRLVLINDSVEFVESLLPKEVLGKVDHVVSGVPFSFFDWNLKIKILNQTKSILRKNGSFLAYQTTGHLKKPIQEVFGNFTTEFVLLNIPPYYIYDAVKRK